MVMSERATWLLPVKNGMPYLTETLASIEAQTYRHWEVLAWDNGSTDETVAELRRWIPSRLPGRVISDRPLSLGHSLARMVEIAETEFCARIDADDINLPERLERQVAFLLEHPEVGVVGSQIEFIGEHECACPEAWMQPSSDAEIRWKLRWENALHHPTVMFRRSVVLAAGNYADCMPYEDYDLWMRVALIAEIANIPRALVKYRFHPTSVTGAKGNPGWAFDAVAARNADSLFSGIPGPAALEIRENSSERSERKVRLWDFVALHEAATKAAISSGKPTSYFRSTSLYAKQQKNLLGKWLRQWAWGRACLITKRRIQSYFGKTLVG